MSDTQKTISALVYDTRLYPAVQRQVETEAPTLALFAGNSELVQGNAFEWVVEGSGAVAESVAEGATLSNFGSNEELRASVALKNHAAPFNISSEAQSVAYFGGVGGSIDYQLGNAKVQSTKKLLKTLEGQLHAITAGTYDMACFRDMIGTTSSYAGIDGNTKTYWRSTVIDANGQAPSDGYVSKLISRVRKASGANDLIGITSHAVLENMIATYKTSRSFTQSPFEAGTVTFGETSYPGVYVNGVKIVAVPDGYHVESSNVGDLVVVSQSAVKLIYQPYVDLNAESNVNSGFLGIGYAQLGRTGNLTKGYVRTRLNIALLRRNAAGIIKNLAGLSGYFS